MSGDVVIPAVAGVVGAVVGSAVSWAGESIRTKASRRYDRRVRQLDEVADLADAVSGMGLFQTGSSLGVEDDLISRENQRLAEIAFEVMGLIGKANRYVLDPEVGAALFKLDRWRNDGAIEVAKGHSLMRELERDPSVDLSKVVTLQVWFLKLTSLADECVHAAKKCLHEDAPVTKPGRRKRSSRGWIDRVLTRTYGGGKAQSDADAEG